MFKLNGEHGEVVTLLGIAYELVHGIGHSLNQLLWRAIEICDDVGDALHAEKFVGSILGLRQSVSIEEEGRVGCYHGFLFNKSPKAQNFRGRNIATYSEKQRYDRRRSA